MGPGDTPRRLEEKLRGFPEAGRGDLIRYFTLTAANEALVWKLRGQGNVLRLRGAAVHAAVGWGTCPDEVSRARRFGVDQGCDRWIAA